VILQLHRRSFWSKSSNRPMSIPTETLVTQKRHFASVRDVERRVHRPIRPIRPIRFIVPFGLLTDTAPAQVRPVASAAVAVGSDLAQAATLVEGREVGRA
jgi:hypothetical protein